MVAVMTVL